MEIIVTIISVYSDKVKTTDIFRGGYFSKMGMYVFYEHGAVKGILVNITMPLNKQ